MSHLYWYNFLMVVNEIIFPENKCILDVRHDTLTSDTDFTDCVVLPRVWVDEWIGKCAHRRMEIDDSRLIKFFVPSRIFQFRSHIYKLLVNKSLLVLRRAGSLQRIEGSLRQIRDFVYTFQSELWDWQTLYQVPQGARCLMQPPSLLL